MSTLSLSLLIFCVVVVLVQAADPDPLGDFFTTGGISGNRSSPFVIRSLLKNGHITNGPGGVRSGLSSKILPGIQSQGLTLGHFVMKPCGLNLPHTHPRASEMVTLVSGGPLQVGFVDTAGKTHIDVLRPGDVTIFPRGMMHFEMNFGTAPAFFISALNSENPGTLTTGGALFNMPDRTVATALNLDLEQVKQIKANLYEYGPSLQMASKDVCTPGKDVGY